MGLFLTIFIVTLLILGGLALWSERRPRHGRPDDDANPRTLLPGDFKYENPSGGFGFYLPITTSLILSLVLTVVLRLFS